MERSREASDGFGGSRRDEVPALDAPYGKRALGATTDPVIQLAGGGGSHHPGAVESAQQGFGGAAQELPHRATIESSFGVDLSSVRAYTGDQAGGACQQLGAEAYTRGSQVAFSSSAPSLQLAAHEAAHVVQQSQGVQLQGKVGKAGDSYERQADAAAERVVAGESARDLLPDFGPITASVGAGAPIQRYSLLEEGNGWRVSDDGKMAVEQYSAVGGQTAYATPELIEGAANKLQQATSSITLEAGNLSGKFEDAEGKEHQLVDVVPVNTKNNTRDTEMELWADCGRSAHTVSGMDGGSGQGSQGSVARYNKDGESKTGKAGDWMEIQKVKMMMDLFTTENPWWKVWKSKYETKLDTKKLAAKLKEYEETKKAWAKAKDKKLKKQLGGQMAGLARTLDELSRAEYNKLDQDAKDDFDKQAGINAYADPEIGEAFHMSTGGDEHPDKEEGVGTWNFHWAGVVMKSGSDTMTLENYSVSNYEVQNKEWVFQMYGVGKKGQSFHEEHRDVHKQHGDAPTSMVATRNK
jgi:hypothetical protein